MGLYRGGRQKGSKNLKTNLHAKCEKVGLDVFERLLELAVKDRDQRGEWNKLIQLAQYLYSKPREELDLSKFSPQEIREYVLSLVKPEQGQIA